MSENRIISIQQVGNSRQERALVIVDFFSSHVARIVMPRGIKPFAPRAYAAIMAAWLVLAARAVKLPLSMTEMAMAFARRSGMIRVREKPMTQIELSSMIGRTRFRSPPPRWMCWRRFSAICSMCFSGLGNELWSFS
jgi:hypothetical protein